VTARKQTNRKFEYEKVFINKNIKFCPFTIPPHASCFICCYGLKEGFQVHRQIIMEYGTKFGFKLGLHLFIKYRTWWLPHLTSVNVGSEVWLTTKLFVLQGLSGSYFWTGREGVMTPNSISVLLEVLDCRLLLKSIVRGEI